jgi:hypothetical protein
MLKLHARRGQTMPFWLVTVVVLLTLFFFATNFVTNLAWHIRAQNAADADASALLSTRTNVFNQETVLLYAGAVNEYRLRYLDQAMLNAINGHGCSGAACSTQYLALRAQYQNALNGMQSVWQLLQRANNFTQGGQFNTDTSSLLTSIQGGLSGDSAFTLTALDCADCGNGGGKKKQSTPGTVDLITCKNIAPVAPGLFSTVGKWQFKAVGRAAAQAVRRPLQGSAPTSFPPGYGANGYTVPTGYSEYVNPGASGQQPPEGRTDADASYIQVNYNDLLIDLSWYATSIIKPYVTPVTSKDYTCS